MTKYLQNQCIPISLNYTSCLELTSYDVCTAANMAADLFRRCFEVDPSTNTSWTVFHPISLFSSGWTSWMSLSTRGRVKPRRQEARLTSPSRLQPPANPRNGCVVSWVTNQLQEWEQPRPAWRGHDPLRLHRSRGGRWEPVAMPTRDRVVTNTRITPSWWEWVASWEHAKCITSATDSISSLAKEAEKTHPPSILRAPIVMDELADTSEHPQQVYLYIIYLSLNVLL